MSWGRFGAVMLSSACLGMAVAWLSAAVLLGAM